MRNLSKSSKQYWMVDDNGQIVFAATSALTDFPFELIPVQEDEVTSLDDVFPDGGSDMTEYYTLGGIRVGRPQPGVGIVRFNNGKISKILR